MADEVKVPGVGKTKKKWVIIGGGAVVGILGIAYWRHRNAANNAATSAASPVTGASYSSGSGQDQYPADGTTGNPNDPYSTDPATGTTYGDEGQSGGFYNEGYAPAGQSPAMGYDSYSGYGGYYYGNTNPTVSSTISTNEEWLTQAENDLQGVGYDQATAAAALSKVLAGLPVTAQQKDIFEQALGIDGNPPQGYKTPIQLVSTPGSTTPNPPKPKTGPVPSVVGETAAAASQHLIARGFKMNGGVSGSAIVQSQSPKAGTMANLGSTVTVVPRPKVTAKKPAPKPAPKPKPKSSPPPSSGGGGGEGED